MKTARMAFDAQNFTLRPPEAPVVASDAPESAFGSTSRRSRCGGRRASGAVGAVAASHECISG